MKYHRITIICLLLSVAMATQAHKKHTVEFLNEGNSPDAPFSEAVRAGKTLYLAGKLGYDRANKRLAPGGIKGETKQAMDNIKATVKK